MLCSIPTSGHFVLPLDLHVTNDNDFFQGSQDSEYELYLSTTRVRLARTHPVCFMHEWGL